MDDPKKPKKTIRTSHPVPQYNLKYPYEPKGVCQYLTARAIKREIAGVA